MSVYQELRRCDKENWVPCQNMQPYASNFIEKILCLTVFYHMFFYYDSGFLVWNWVRIGWYMLLVFTSQFCKEFIFNVLRLLVGNFYIHVLFWQMCFSSIYHGIYVLCIFTYTWKNSNLHINYMYLNVELKL